MLNQPSVSPHKPAGRTSLGGLDSGKGKRKKISGSFFDIAMMSLLGSLGNSWKCGLEHRKEIQARDAMSHQHLDLH